MFRWGCHGRGPKVYFTGASLLPFLAVASQVTLGRWIVRASWRGDASETERRAGSIAWCSCENIFPGWVRVSVRDFVNFNTILVNYAASDRPIPRRPADKSHDEAHSQQLPISS